MFYLRSKNLQFKVLLTTLVFSLLTPGCQFHPGVYAKHQVAVFLLNQALRQENAGLFNSAQATANLGLNLDPGNPLAYYIRGIINLDLQKYVNAIEDFTRSLDCAAKKSAKDRATLEKFSHETEWLFLFRGRCYARLGDYKKAEADFKRALRANPDLALIYCDLGEIYYQADLYDLALANFDKSALLDPQNEKVFNLRALVYNAKGEYAAAVRDFSLAIDLKPDETLYCNRGVSYTNSGLYEKALLDFNESLRRNPRYHAAWFFKGETFRLQGRSVEAADAYARYLKLANSPQGLGPANSALSDHIAKAKNYLETNQKNPNSHVK